MTKNQITIPRDLLCRLVDDLEERIKNEYGDTYKKYADQRLKRACDLRDVFEAQALLCEPLPAQSLKGEP